MPRREPFDSKPLKMTSPFRCASDRFEDHSAPSTPSSALASTAALRSSSARAVLPAASSSSAAASSSRASRALARAASAIASSSAWSSPPITDSSLVSKLHPENPLMTSSSIANPHPISLPQPMRAVSGRRAVMGARHSHETAPATASRPPMTATQTPKPIE